MRSFQHHGHALASKRIENQQRGCTTTATSDKNDQSITNDGAHRRLNAPSLSAAERFSTTDKAALILLQLEQSGPTKAATTLN